MSKVYGDNSWQGGNNYGNHAGKAGINFGRGENQNTRSTGNWGDYTDYGRNSFHSGNQIQLAATIELLAEIVGQIEQGLNELKEEGGVADNLAIPLFTDSSNSLRWLPNNSESTEEEQFWPDFPFIFGK